MNTITLQKMLPRVFVSEPIPESDIWKTDFIFKKGNYYLVEATSGGGKSSLCSFIFGARIDFEGRLLFDSTDSATLNMKQWQEIRRRNIAYLPQELSLFNELSALENIMLKNRLTDFYTETEISIMMENLGIAFRREYPVGKMSIGQQQRVAIIRSLCQPFDFILLDEPVSHLDPENNRIAAEMICSAASQRGAGIITTSVGNHLMIENACHIKL